MLEQAADDDAGGVEGSAGAATSQRRGQVLQAFALLLAEVDRELAIRAESMKLIA